MASITIRNLDNTLKQRLRIQAARHGHSMEEEARSILRTALTTPDRAPENLAERIRQRFAAVGGVDLDIPPREPLRAPPDFNA